MKFSIYLFKQEFQDFEGLIEKHWLEPVPGMPIDPKQQQKGYYKPVELRYDLGYECKAYFHTGGGTPNWYSLVNEGFNIGKLANGNSSFVLFIKRPERIFAYTFGYAYAALDYTKIETNFGLKTALNMIGAAELRQMEAKSIENVATYKQVQTSVPVDVASHEVNVFTNFITSVSSKPMDNSFGKEVKGSDNLKVTREKAKLTNLADHCDEYLDYFIREDYKAYHSYIDYVKPIQHDIELLKKLDSKLLEAFMTEDEKLFIMQPRIQNDLPDKFSVNIRDTKKDQDVCEYLEIPYFRDYFDLASKRIAGIPNYKNKDRLILQNIQIQPLDDEDRPNDNRRTLYDYLIFECFLDNTHYVFSNGKWFSIEKDYFDIIQARIDSIDDISDELKLMDYERGGEGEYNIGLAKQRGWKCLDKRDYRIPNQPLQKIEVCDILTDNRDFICVKKMRASEALSHLFSQVFVSAELLQREPTYRDYVQREALNTFPDIRFDNGAQDVRFIIGIITDKPGTLADTMFAFSKINLVQRLYSMGNPNIALCKIHSRTKIK